MLCNLTHALAASSLKTKLLLVVSTFVAGCVVFGQEQLFARVLAFINILNLKGMSSVFSLVIFVVASFEPAACEPFVRLVDTDMCLHFTVAVAVLAGFFFLPTDFVHDVFALHGACSIDYRTLQNY